MGRADQASRRWTITCQQGDFQTLSLPRGQAVMVAEWCNDHFPHCGPHDVLSRERRQTVDGERVKGA